MPVVPPGWWSLAAVIEGQDIRQGLARQHGCRMLVGVERGIPVRCKVVVLWQL